MRRVAIELVIVFAASAAAAAWLTRGLVAPVIARPIGGIEIPFEPATAAPGSPTATSWTTLPGAEAPPFDSSRERSTPSTRPLRDVVRRIRDFTELTRGLRYQLLPASRGGGYEVLAVDPTGELARAGVRVGDVLIEANGHATLSADGLLEAAASANASHRAVLRFRRGGDDFTVRAVFSP